MGTIKRTFANNILTDGKIDATDLSGTISASNIANASVTAVTELPSALGDAIESVATDPVSPSEGQLWYNTTIGILKGYLLTSAAWASGGTLPGAKGGASGGGVQTAAWMAGGERIPNSPNSGGLPTQTSTFEYDGSTWAAGGTMGTARTVSEGAGSQTSAYIAGGRTTNNPFTYTGNTEEYDGSTWTAGGSIGSAAYYGLRSGIGTQTAGLIASGILIGNPGYQTTAKEYDGTSWTAANPVNTAGGRIGGAGIQTSGIIFGGTSRTTASEEYNGTSFTSGNSLNTGRPGAVGAGNDNTNVIAFGGNVPNGETEQYNGTSWATISATLGTARDDGTSAGTQTSALYAGGVPDQSFTGTEEFTGAFVSTKKVTTS